MGSYGKVGIAAVFVVVSCTTIVIWRAPRAKAKSPEQDNDIAKIRALAEQGDVRAEYKLGKIYGNGRGVARDYAAAFRWCHAAAEKGDSEAEYAVGYSYDTGTGVKQDIPEAIRWYQKAADQNDRRAQHTIAGMYYDGRGMERDWTKAAVWYRRAAENGLPRAQYDLGYMYYYGQGLAQDRAEAMRWFRAALKQGDAHARQWLSYRLTVPRIVFLVIQTLFGLTLAFRSWSFNFWEPNEPPRNFRSWYSIGLGWACLIAAGMGWWGYSHGLLWNCTYGVTAFILSKMIINFVVIALLLIFLFLQRNMPRESESAVPVE